MKARNKAQKRRAFTLIEIIFVIAIVAILLAILLPGMSSMKQSAQKVRDVSNLKKIAEAWKELAINRGKDMETVQDPLKFIRFLAGHEGTSSADIILNDPSVYISPGDKYASKVLKETICRFDSDNNKVVSNDDVWSKPGTVLGLPWSKEIFSYYFMNPPANVPLDTTPLAWTRGLTTEGTWDKTLGLYGDKGGYVVYCDGHVTWFDGSKPARFLQWDNKAKGYTSNLLEAIRGAGTSTITIPGGGRMIEYIYKGEER
jgi:prepilin-type N-terminal cleavage/methylation domain-containing protein/prepilin-type processing-associated H-X9-DG protein